MRAAIRQKLIDDIPDIENRCYEPQAASKDVEKPYLVLMQGADAEDTPWTGFRRIIEIWPYATRTTFQKVDELAKKVIASLDKQLITDVKTGEVFSCQYLGSVSEDYVDEDWDAITRGLRFAVLALQPVGVTESVANDPWIDALAKWTEDILGEDWKVYKNAWPLGYVRPSVMWRITNIDTAEKARGMFELRKKIAGHVIGRTKNEEMAATVMIVQEMMNAIKIPISEAGRWYMTVNKPAIDYRADAVTAGQISVVMSRFTGRPQEEFELMEHIESTGQLNER